MINMLPNKAFDVNFPFVLAMDGPSASGKGLIGRMLAKNLNLDYFQSSLLYRKLAFMCAKANINIDDIVAIEALSLLPAVAEFDEEPDLSSEEISSLTSRIATIAAVRSNLSKHLVQIINSSHRILMEGRDIGTVIAPDADLKIFITADLETRANRRYKQLLSEGKDCIMREVFEKLQERDLRDKGRSVAPLMPAKDALIIDTTNMTPQEVLNKIIGYLHS